MSPQKGAPPKAASETQLIARAQQGDEEAFSALFEAHKRRVYSLCLRMTGNTAEAEDLAQEAFLQLFRKISTFRGESAFSTWLHRLSVNVVLMHLRKKGLQQVSLDGMDTSQEEPVKRDYRDDDRRLLGPKYAFYRRYRPDKGEGATTRPAAGPVDRTRNWEE